MMLWGRVRQTITPLAKRQRQGWELAVGLGRTWHNESHSVPLASLDLTSGNQWSIGKGMKSSTVDQNAMHKTMIFLPHRT
jgi:site-specific recombinase XerC